MITITFFAKEIEQDVKFNVESVTGFRTEGHAGYAEYGNDIICAAVSILVMTTINSIEELTSSVFITRRMKREVTWNLSLFPKKLPKRSFYFNPC
jgi:uncharacterized protein YsxB (DUF464 family)